MRPLILTIDTSRAVQPLPDRSRWCALVALTLAPLFMAAFSARRAGYLRSICCHLTPMTTVAAGGGAASPCWVGLGQLTRLAVVPRVVFPLRKQRQEISVAGCDRPDRSLVKLLRRVPPGSSFDSAALVAVGPRQRESSEYESRGSSPSTSSA